MGQTFGRTYTRLDQLRFMNIRKEMLSDLFWTLQIDPNGEYLANLAKFTAIVDL